MTIPSKSRNENANIENTQRLVSYLTSTDIVGKYPKHRSQLTTDRLEMKSADASFKYT
jgi:hypothetical protein